MGALCVVVAHNEVEELMRLREEVKEIQPLRRRIVYDVWFNCRQLNPFTMARTQDYYFGHPMTMLFKAMKILFEEVNDVYTVFTKTLSLLHEASHDILNIYDCRFVQQELIEFEEERRDEEYYMYDIMEIALGLNFYNEGTWTWELLHLPGITPENIAKLLVEAFSPIVHSPFSEASIVNDMQKYLGEHSGEPGDPHMYFAHLA